MPIHEYRCKACGQTRDHLVGVTSDATELVCPECGSRDLSRSLSLFAVSLRTGSSPAGDCGSCEQQAGGHSCCGGGCAHG